MAETLSPETFREKLYLLIIDKIALGLIVAVATAVLTWQLQRQDKAMEYQQALFAKRQEAYQALLIATREARDELSILYVGKRAAHAPTSLAWRDRLERLQQKAQTVTGHGGGSSSYTFYPDAIKTLQTVDQVRRDNELLISSAVDRAVNDFLQTVAVDVEKALDDQSRKVFDIQWETQASLRATQAYDKLVSVIRQSLRVDDVILG